MGMAIHQDLAPDMHLPELSCRHSAFDLPMRLVQHFQLAGHESSFCDLNAGLSKQEKLVAQKSQTLLVEQL